MAPTSRSSRFPVPSFVLALALAACGGAVSPGAPPTLTVGTWGANGSAVLVGDSTLHVHIGCTKGDFPIPAVTDGGGRFVVAGTYNVRAYPIEHLRDRVPAVLTGTLEGRRLTLRIAVDDTVTGKDVTLGPVTVTRGVVPVMGPCPICRMPGAQAAPPGAWARARDWWRALWS